MSDFFGRFPFFDTSDLFGQFSFLPAGIPAIPEWMIGALAAVILLACVFAFSRVARLALKRGLSTVGLVLIGVGIAWVVFGGPSRRDLAAERLALDARAAELTLRAIAPGSALSCLHVDTGDALAASCEKALFATPEAAAAAVSFVSAQLALLADSTALARRDPSYRGIIAQLRHSAETDRYGIVAHVLATGEACTPIQCDAFALLKDSSRVNANLAEHPYDAYVARYAANWPAAAESPMARSSSQPSLASAPAASSATGIKVPGPNVFFPSAASIPPVNIMNAEPPPPTPPETTGTNPPAAKAAAPQRKAPPAPPRRPANAKADTQRAPPPPAAE
jgi:hypothetical protein